MGEILSRAEVDAILSSIEPSRSTARSSASMESVDITAWGRHDITRPAVLQGRALKIAQALHEGICQRWVSGLKGLLPSNVEVRSVGACQSTVAEFLASLQSPHVTCQVSHTSSAAESLLIWSDQLVQLLIARLLGGTVDEAGESRVHLMTNIELRLLGRLNEAVLRELSALLNDKLTVSAVMQQVSMVPASIAAFSCIWFSFELTASAATGLIHLGIPAASVGLNRSADESGEPGLTADTVPSGIQQVTVQVAASLASLKVKASDLAALQVGDIVMTDQAPNHGISLQLGDQVVCQATIGTHLGRKALRLIEPPNR
ncbi:MAG TPA: FliM/FliN family flagellar motor switch protein [Schlesneria sp.]|jgi:flagellar motor switch protein FliM